MRLHAFAVAFLLSAAPGASTLAQEERPALNGISVVRIANYNTPSTVIQDRTQVNGIVGELRELRARDWRRADAKLYCYATMVLLRGEKTLTLLRIGAEHVVERAPGKKQSVYSLAAGPAELPRIHALLAAIPPAKDCPQ
jgi:hypothetical protein